MNYEIKLKKYFDSADENDIIEVDEEIAIEFLCDECNCDERTIRYLIENELVELTIDEEELSDWYVENYSDEVDEYLYNKEDSIEYARELEAETHREL